MIPVLDTAFAAFAKLLGVIDKAIPSDALREARFKEQHPVRFERIQQQAIKKKLRQLRTLHRFVTKNGVNEADLVKYVGGDTTTAQLLTQMKKP